MDEKSLKDLDPSLKEKIDKLRAKYSGTVDDETAEELAKEEVRVGGDNAVDEGALDNFTIVVNRIHDFKLKSAPFHCFVIIKSYAFGKREFCFPAMETIRRKMSCSLPTVWRARKALENAGIVITERRGLTKTNKYILTDIRKGPERLLEEKKKRDEEKKKQKP